MWRIGCLAVVLLACEAKGPAPTAGQDGGVGDSGPALDATALDAAAPDAAAPIEPFTVGVFDDVRISSQPGDAHFHNVRGSFDLGAGPFAEVTLFVELDTTCYPFERWREDPPPRGHNWPPRCDAYDRNFEVVLDEPPPGEDGPPGIEVMRAITPFGGPASHVIDLTDLANARPGAHPIRIHITTWSDGAGQVSGSNGGWQVSARVAVTPGPAPRSVVLVEPLFDGSIGADHVPEALPFVTPPGITEARLEYRVTGHGGGEARRGIDDCIGHADEFCRRSHSVFFDGRRERSFVPWRDDCADFCTRAQASPSFGSRVYCAENPTGSIRSVEAPRANWCPGALTPPFEWSVEGWIQPGPHDFAFLVADVHPQGSWRVSAAVYLYDD